MSSYLITRGQRFYTGYSWARTERRAKKFTSLTVARAVAAIAGQSAGSWHPHSRYGVEAAARASHVMHNVVPNLSVAKRARDEVERLRDLNAELLWRYRELSAGRPHSLQDYYAAHPSEARKRISAETEKGAHIYGS